MLSINPILSAGIGTGFSFLMTTAGAAVVFFLKIKGSPEAKRFFLGFASGVMIAASIWSLILPAIDRSAELGMVPWLPTATGFSLGGIFFVFADKYLPVVINKIGCENKRKIGRNLKLVLAVTLHNIPEGMAIGLAFAMAFRDESSVTLASAVALAVGIGIQNFPEGAAISLPLFDEGHTKKYAFAVGAASGIVEPIGGIFTVLIAKYAVWMMPWLLAFAAGCMIFVVADELIPEAYREKDSNIGAVGVMAGFLLMMVLDVALG